MRLKCKSNHGVFLGEMHQSHTLSMMMWDVGLNSLVESLLICICQLLKKEGEMSTQPSNGTDRKVTKASYSNMDMFK